MQRGETDELVGLALTEKFVGVVASLPSLRKVTLPAPAESVMDRLE